MLDQHRSGAALLDGLPCGLITTDAGCRVLAANDTLGRWLDYDPHDLRQLHLRQLLTMGGRLFHQTHLAPLLQMQGSVGEVQLQLRHRSGNPLPMLTAITRSHDAHGSITDQYAFMLSTDRRKYEEELLAARQRAETALEERRAALDALRGKEAELRATNSQLRLLDQRKDQFLAVLGHELRNPLTPMRSGLDLLRSDKIDNPVVRRVFDVFERQVSFMSHLVEDLMDVSRIGKGKLQLKHEPVRVSDVVQRAVELATPLFVKAGQTLQVEARDDCLVQGDLIRLTQVLGNLLNNASKYTPSNGSAWIRHERRTDAVVITVRDTGIGIEPARLEDVFSMFSQEQRATERAQGGVGIGLGLVKGLVELHGGSVRAHSAGPGFGSSFVVTLPCMAAVPPRTDVQCA